jgi:UDP-N-acetylglucosamine diphosphorylase / glucose-1-phosphate thymidylyltransferase / UDP-N-acetylgalactosamine diphosphorylase / glucosamine-1-phosphate N-acetyltransferase / galactosamine-1-phosphate N-acetyltransferase
MSTILHVVEYIPQMATSLFEANIHLNPWKIVEQAEALIINAIPELPKKEYRIDDMQAIHHTATVEAGSLLKGPLIIGPGCYVACGSLLRGGVFLERDCIVGHNSELKTSFMFGGSKIAHLNFVGDSILGRDVNVEAGAIIANYRNEKKEKEIQVLLKGQRITTGVTKFGALVGDGTRIGANAVLAPGTILAPNTIVKRLELIDQTDDGE